MIAIGSGKRSIAGNGECDNNSMEDGRNCSNSKYQKIGVRSRYISIPSTAAYL